MKRHATLILVATLAWMPRTGRADEVQLKGGGVIGNVKVTREGDGYRLSRAQGSSWIPADEIARVILKPTAFDELAERKLKAGDDPAALRDLARWAGENGLRDEKANLLALARGIELEHKIAAIGDAKTAAPYLELARSMKDGGGYSDAEVKAVYGRALVLEPENAEVRFGLGQVKRDGRWVTLAEARILDEEREARVMEAQGLVRFEGRWVTPAEKEKCEAAREQEALRARLAQLEAERRAEADARAADAAQRAADAESAAAAARQAQADAEARIAAERQSLEDERARLAAQRNSIDSSCYSNGVTVYGGVYGPVYYPHHHREPARPVCPPVISATKPQYCPPAPRRTTVVVTSRPAPAPRVVQAPVRYTPPRVVTAPVRSAPPVRTVTTTTTVTTTRRR